MNSSSDHMLHADASGHLSFNCTGVRKVYGDDVQVLPENEAWETVVAADEAADLVEFREVRFLTPRCNFPHADTI